MGAHRHITQHNQHGHGEAQSEMSPACATTAPRHKEYRTQAYMGWALGTTSTAPKRATRFRSN